MYQILVFKFTCIRHLFKGSITAIVYLLTVGYYVGSLRSLAVFKQVERAKKERKSR